MPKLIAAPDKFRGTLKASEAANAIAKAAVTHGWDVDEVPVADGGEGTLDAMGGLVRRTRVTGPLGAPVEAEWRLLQGGHTAVIEMAMASGLVLAGGKDHNNPLDATTKGTGELIAAAIDSGADHIVVGLGGSATTDGGLGAVEALGNGKKVAGVDLAVACDVTTRFTDAARVFGPQKGATEAQVQLLERRLQRLGQIYQERFGIDVLDLEGAGAAGGLAGGLAAIGARLTPGFELIAEALGLEEHMEGAKLVVSGEGFLDSESFHGKAVGGVAETASRMGIDVLVVAGAVEEGLSIPPGVTAVGLVDRFGRERAMEDTAAAVQEVVEGHLAGLAAT